MHVYGGRTHIDAMPMKHLIVARNCRASQYLMALETLAITLLWVDSTLYKSPVKATGLGLSYLAHQVIEVKQLQSVLECLDPLHIVL